MNNSQFGNPTIGISFDLTSLGNLSSELTAALTDQISEVMDATGRKAGAAYSAAFTEEASNRSRDSLAASLAVREGLQKAFRDRNAKEEQGVRQRKTDGLRQEERELELSAERKEITLRQFQERAARLSERRETLEREDARQTSDLAERVRRAGIIASDDYYRYIDRQRQKSTAAFAENAATEKRVLTDISLTAAAEFASLVASGRNATDSFLVATFDAAANYLNAMAPVWLAAALGTSFMEGPLGILTLAASTASIEIAVFEAKQALHLKEGRVRIRGNGLGGGGDYIPVLAADDESVMRSEATNAPGNEHFFRWANANPGAGIHDYYRKHFGVAAHGGREPLGEGNALAHRAGQETTLVLRDIHRTMKQVAKDSGFDVEISGHVIRLAARKSAQRRGRAA